MGSKFLVSPPHPNPPTPTTGDPYPLQLIPTTMAAAAAATPGLGPLQLQVREYTPYYQPKDVQMYRGSSGGGD